MGKKTLMVKKMQTLPVAEDLKVKAKVKAGERISNKVLVPRGIRDMRILYFK